MNKTKDLAAYTRQWRKDNPEKYQAQRARDRAKANAKDPHWSRRNWLRSKYGITFEMFEQMSEAQGHVCAICKEPEIIMQNGKVKAFSVDHNHTTGQVRGLLCKNCNVSLGGFRDNITYLKSAIEYLENWDKENG